MLLKLLHAIGLTNLTDEQVARYESLARTAKGGLLLRFLHSVGLTNLTEKEVEQCSFLQRPPLSFSYTDAATWKLPNPVPPFPTLRTSLLVGFGKDVFSVPTGLLQKAYDLHRKNPVAGKWTMVNVTFDSGKALIRLRIQDGRTGTAVH